MDFIFWLCAMVVFILVEAFTAALVSIWFAVGALVAAICSLMGLGDTTCVMVFVVVSAVVLFVFKKLYNKKKPEYHPTNADRVIGAQGVVEEEIDPVKGSGAVLVLGRLWSAKADECIEINSSVRVCAIEGVKLVVEKI